MLDKIENLVLAYNSAWIRKTTLNGVGGGDELNFSWYFIEICALMSRNYGVPSSSGDASALCLVMQFGRAPKARGECVLGG